HTKVRATINLTGLYLGDGVWGDAPHTTHYSIGESHISIVDVSKHTMTVTSNGKVLRRMPMSAGRRQFPTHAGVHLTVEKEKVHFMDSATIGIPRNSPGGYYKRVE